MTKVDLIYADPEVDVDDYELLVEPKLERTKIPGSGNTSAPTGRSLRRKYIKKHKASQRLQATGNSYPLKSSKTLYLKKRD